jgi:Fur family ferric uptake transcriptional regulator
MSKSESIFRLYLQKQGMRFTPERHSILKEISSRSSHFEVEDLVQQLRSKGEKVSTASVYRTIPLLIDAGIIIKNPCDQMQARLEPVLGHEHHDHLVCIKCKKIVEFRDDEIEKLQETVAKNHGFLMEGHRLVISGYCSNCAMSSNSWDHETK